MDRAGRGRLAGRVLHGLIALAVSGAVLGLLAFGYGPIPALGRALDPGHGAWAAASGALPARSQTLALAGLAHPVSVTFTSHGVPSIRASSQDDAFLALGYLHACFRLSEMDAERRLGEGRLAQLAGPAGLPSDKFELRLGLLRTAQQEWAGMPRSGPAAQALLAYSRGVNDYLGQARADGHWPAIFGLTGVYPRDWTPVDSLVLQGDLTQQLDFTTAPLDYALLERSLGVARTMAFAPHRRGPVSAWLLACLAGAVIVAGGALIGWWFLPFLAGLAAGLAARYARLRLRATLPAVVVVATAGWGAALAWLVFRDGLPEMDVARTIAALAGLPASAAAAIAVTLLVAAIQAIAGLWLGRALAPGHG